MFQSETEFVRWLGRFRRGEDRSVTLGIGDDAALVLPTPGRELVLTTDLSIEGVHFTRALHPSRSVGHRSLARSLSDIAAMGGVPRYALVSLAISSQVTRAWVEGFYAGLASLAKRFQVSLIGGDTAVVSGSVTIDVMAAGQVEQGRALVRSGARPGDQICVSGTLGQSALGLALLRRGLHASQFRKGTQTLALTRAGRQAIRAHLYPEPQCALGRLLSKKRIASAAMDLSDGLSQDLARLCEASGVGATIWAKRVPTPETRTVPGSPLKALNLALHGGEDYQLLFTVPPRRAPRIRGRFQDVPLHRIGEINATKKLVLVGMDGKERPLEPQGYDHFRKH